MPDPANRAATLVSQLKLEAATLDPTGNRDDLCSTARRIMRLTNELLYRIEAEIIAELRSNSPMPEHGFTGTAAREAPRPKYTVDDLL